MEALSYCQLMERCLVAEARVVEMEQRIATQREYYEGVIADGGERIAELESRTVKLPDSLISYGDEVLISDIVDAIRTAGIKWEAE